MRKFHAIALAVTSAVILTISCGAAMAQAVSDQDAYQQGYAAGASAKEHNSFSTFDNGFRAGQTSQSNSDSQAATVQAYNSAQAYDRGFQEGIARANNDRDHAYNQGYQERAQQEQRMTDHAFDRGYDAGAYQQSRDDADYP